MKVSLVSRLILVGLLAVGSEAVFAKVLKFNGLPPAVQREAQTELKNGPVKKVESIDRNGQTIYALTFQRPDGSSKYVYLDANGTYVRDQNSSPATVSTPTAQPQNLQMSQLPDAVQRTIQTETKNGPVSQIEQLSQGGTSMYQVTFNEPNGQQKVIYLNPDGTYVQNNGQATAQGTRSWDRIGMSSRQPLSASTKVSLNQLPAAVQRTFLAEAGSAPIESIDRGTLNGKAVSEATFKRNARTVKLRVADDGSIIQDAQDNRIIARGPLAQPRQVAFNQLPSAVQNALRVQAGGSQIQNVQEGQLNGQTVYQASINRNGQMLQVRVDPAGSVLSTTQAQSSIPAVQP